MKSNFFPVIASTVIVLNILSFITTEYTVAFGILILTLIGLCVFTGIEWIEGRMLHNLNRPFKSAANIFPEREEEYSDGTTDAIHKELVKSIRSLKSKGFMYKTMVELSDRTYIIYSSDETDDFNKAISKEDDEMYYIYVSTRNGHHLHNASRTFMMYVVLENFKETKNMTLSERESFLKNAGVLSCQEH